ncbi:MAG TPA: methenyltetrahydromethanopterin cyclohydrolase [Planctomycetota bacterium]|nr:methenyltetrahydromethanopterin cyclohydrolase [Planctomycetota bacterium]
MAAGALDLNNRALLLAERMVLERERLGIVVSTLEAGGRILDAGVEARGGLEAGLALARLTLADLGEVSLVPGDIPRAAFPRVQVATDHPVSACMASQYAGWQISAGKFFAMGSGPMRAAYGAEELFQRIGRRERTQHAVGVLETGAVPTAEVFSFLAEKLGLDPGRITLAAARTRSLAGSIQVVSRSVETALHKLDLLGFDLERIESGFGSAPLPPPSASDIEAIGRTNDAILYGARVTLWVRGDDDSIAAVGPRVPASASKDHGTPFAEVFERYERDFYRIDPLLFSPAEVTFQNLDTGRTRSFGSLEPAVLERSFLGE